MDRQASTTKSDLERMLSHGSMEAKALPLPFTLLDYITNGFSCKQEIGCGGFAVVYKGLLENGAVAVKKLSETSDIDERKFHGEVDCLMKAKHKNIVRFLGYCCDTQGQWVEHNGKCVMADVRHRLLCFEYLPNGSLDKYIKDASLEWGKCYKIIKGVCEGLHYLHKKQIVHSDLKPPNILLDKDMVPKITDFGISRCFDGKQTHIVTENIMGSLGYLSPEVFYGKISFKSDIFSLGVIIIEILTANKDYPDAKDVLKYWEHKVEKSQKEQQLEQIRVCTEVGQSCLEYYPAKRPSAQNIIDVLKQTERKQRCIETGAGSSTVPHTSSHVEEKNKSSSSTVPHASSLVQNKNKPPRWRSFKIETFKNKTLGPKTLVRTRMAVTQAICEFYAQGRSTVSFAELYRHGYNLVLHSKGEELYCAVETTMALEVQRLCRPLDAAPADGAAFLQELLAMWNQHIKAVNVTRDMLMYMDRTFVLSNHKTPIKELGLRLWRDNMARSDKIRPRLIEAVKRQRGGEAELVDGVNKMLRELGAEVMEVPCLFFRDGAGKLHAAGP